ncbi:MAG TPA: hypothetical protein H9810_04360 [Candidatus Gemmiger excrementavium]|uniref:Uncharacterized protein n=1 Tax=Candidatus Gemmiger excrementavium TaxID=2838608 RepID=A0A9D2F2Z9_9FIRM|nr:hypothetical protein [Candidatus Gemmiger excrementavium]
MGVGKTTFQRGGEHVVQPGHQPPGAQPVPHHQRRGPQVPHQVQAAAVGQVHVQDQQGKVLALQQRPGLGHGAVRRLQRQGDAPAQGFVIL